jgi:hypothetical protein
MMIVKTCNAQMSQFSTMEILKACVENGIKL